MDDKERIKQLEQENQFLKEELRKRGYFIYDENHILTKDEKISIFMNYFKGREDVYAKRYYSKKMKTYGWSQACLNEFKNGCMKGKKKNSCATCECSKYESLETSIVFNHFTGRNIGIGVYPLLLDNTCYFLAIDFDENDWFDEMVSIAKIASSYALNPVMERSASGLGGHLWIFFEQAIPAFKARNLGELLIQKAMQVNPKLKFNSFDRMFPNQDILPKGGFGNLIALPLRFDALKKGNSCFINEFQQVIQHPVEYLASIRKNREEDIDRILEQQVNDYFFDNDQLGFRFDLDDAQNIKIHGFENNMLCIDKKNLNSLTLNILRRIASMYNPEYYLLQNLKQPIYRNNTPRVLSLYEEDERYIYLPRGCKEKINEVFAQSEIMFVDQTKKGHPIDVSFIKELRPHQMDPVEKLLKYKTGVMKAVPGFGKTVMALYIVGKLKVNTLVIVPSKEIQNQWVDRINEFLEVPQAKLKRDCYVCIFNGSKKRLNKNIDIATASSLSNLDNLEEVLNEYGCVIVDECHHAASNTFTQVLRHVASEYIYSFSATPERKDKLEKIMYMFCGPLRYETNKYEIQNSYTFQQILIPRFTNFSELKPKDNYVKICTALMQNQTRNILITKDVIQEYNKDGKIIVLTERVEHLEILYEMLKYVGEHVYYLNGQMKIQERKAILDQVRSLKNDEKYILLATSQLLGEGFDLPSLKTLFLVLPISGEGRITQYTGRIHRNYEGKDIVKVYDYVDVRIPMMEAMFHKRMKQYQKEGYYVQEKEEAVEVSKMIYEEQTYKKTFLRDIDQAKKEIVILNSTISLSKIKTYFSLLQEKFHQRVNITFVLPEHVEKEIEISRYLKGMGADIVYKNHAMHFMVIDQTIVWHSNIDFFGRSRKGVYSVRFTDQLLSEEIIENI